MSADGNDSSTNFVDIESRLTQIEAKLRIGVGAPQHGPVVDETAIDAVDVPSSVELQHGSLADDTNFTFDYVPSPVAQTEGYHLPPLQDILPIIEDYFVNFNSVVPLFHQGHFMRMLQEWYSSPFQREDPASWAAINVVLALSLRQGGSSKAADANQVVGRCINNAQSVLNSLMTRDQDLKGIQVVLGLVILFQGTRNPRPASILVATAVKLAHRLRLHTKHGRDQFDAHVALERDCVFWITYVLDKDVSMRAEEPYMQQDHDVDVDLPDLVTVDDRTGVMGDGRIWLNFFLCRIHLARIQARVYDWTYSVQAKKLPDGERQANTKRLDRMLRDWKRAIPDEFQPDMLPGALPGVVTRHFTMLYFTQIHCLFMARRIFSHDAEWIRRLTEYSERYAIGYQPPPAEQEFQSPLPSSWPEDVNTSRACMRLFRLVNQSDSALAE